jgi:3-polyprenyl-4-hydroxybenzoate decarboxylase
MEGWIRASVGKMSIRNMIGTKEQMATYFQEEDKKDFQEMMEKLLESPPPKLMQKLASAVSNQHISTQAPQMQLVPVVSQPLVAQSETIIPSSVASMANNDHYPVDDIVLVHLAP